MPAAVQSQPDRRGVWTATYILLLLFSVGLMVAAAYLRTRALAPTLATDLLNELGIAGFVAFVLALTIERLSAKEFERRAQRERDLLREQFRTLADQERADLKKDVFYYTYGRNLPQAIRDDLDHYFLQADFIRSKLYLQFDLSIETDPHTSKAYVKSICLTSSHIQNLTGESKAFPIDHSIDPSPSDALGNDVKYLEFSCTGSKDEFSLTENELTRITRRDAGRVALKLGEKQQVVVLPEKPTALKIRYQGIRAMEGAGIYFVFTTHTCGLELTVHVENSDLDVFAEAYSPHQLVQTDRHDPAVGYHNWTIEEPLLAHQGLRVNWHRASVPVSQISQPVAAPVPTPPAPPNPSPGTSAASINSAALHRRIDPQNRVRILIGQQAVNAAGAKYGWLGAHSSRQAVFRAFAVPCKNDSRK